MNRCTNCLYNQLKWWPSQKIRLFSYTANQNLKSHPPWNILFFGSDLFSIPSLNILNHNRAEVAGGLVSNLEVMTVQASPHSYISKRAEELKLKTYNYPREITPGRYDVGVVVSFGHILPQALINSFPYGIINVHPSLLPRWRGAAPIIHTILNGDTITGVSIMRIQSKIDTGPIIIQKKVAVPNRSTSIDLHSILSNQGANLLIECLKDLPTLISQEVKQDNQKATKAPKLTKQMAIVDWKKHTCQDIDQQYRAFVSYLSTTTYEAPVMTSYKGNSVRLFDMVDPALTKDIDKEDFKDLPPGSTKYNKSLDILLIKCKDGLVGFKYIALKKRHSALDFQNGYLLQHKATGRYIVLGG